MEVSTTFSQVVFQNIPHSYTPNVPVTCRYTLTSAIQMSPRDWVGMFKVGWSNIKDYHTFVWVEPSVDLEGQDPAMKQVMFATYYLPKDEAEFYQFCYVDSTGLVRGASIPFCFKTPEEQSTDNSLENDLVIITTKEKVDQHEREQDELARELRQQRELNETLKSTLKEQQQQIDFLKLSNEGSCQANRNLEKYQQNARDLVPLTQNSKPTGDSPKGLEDKLGRGEIEKAELAMELQQLKEQNEALTSALKEQQKEVGCFKEKMERNERDAALLAMELKDRKEQNLILTSALQRKQNESMNTSSEKYDQALTKIKQLKSERAGLKRQVEEQSGEIAQLSPKLIESEQESSRLKDHIQLLQVDLRSTEKEKEKISAELRRTESLTHNLEDLKTENKALRQSLSEQGPRPENVDGDLKAKYQGLLSQLQEADTRLQQELQVSDRWCRRAEYAESELEELKKRMESTVKSSSQMTQKSSKLEMKLTELHGVIQEKENLAEIAEVEKAELSRENQVLKRDIEKLRREVADLTAAQQYVHHSNPYGSSSEPNPTEVQHQDSQANTLYFGNPYEIPGTAANPHQDELSLACRHCHESFPGITREELDLHELSHRVCPFCTLICDEMEQPFYEDHVYSHEV